MIHTALNLSTGDHYEVDPAGYDVPLFVAPMGVCMEVLFWSSSFGAWIYLVRGRHTGRPIPPPHREILVEELPYYASQFGA